MSATPSQRPSAPGEKPQPVARRGRRASAHAQPATGSEDKPVLARVRDGLVLRPVRQQPAARSRTHERRAR